MEFTKEYKEETDSETAHCIVDERRYYSDDYVGWLEDKINYLHSCEKLKEKEAQSLMIL